MLTNFIGHGPSRAQAIEFHGQKAVMKIFPDTERERVVLETHKMQTLREMSAETQLFKVPKILEITPTTYTMEFIPDCKDLNMALNHFPVNTTVERITRIINFFATKPGYSTCPVWDVMLEKFKALKIDNERYNRAVVRLPLHLNIWSSFSHGDLSFDNVLVDSKGEWYLIDPAWSKAESPYWDIGKVFQSTAFNWEYIKHTGRRGPRSDKLVAINDGILNQFFSVQDAQLQFMLLGTACQLARVARWCYAETLVPIINTLLETYLNESNDDRCLDALRGTV